MADTEPVASAPDAQQPASADQPPANGDVTIPQADVEAAGKQATTEVPAPDGDGTAEASIEQPSATAEDNGSTPNKEKKRKSSSGVPEHKTKKLNKKKSTPTLRLDCKPGDLYWARLKGYPAWPAVICDEEMLPETLLASRPVSAARPDGSLRDDFKEGGKSAKDRTYPIMFLSTNEFAWLINTALTPLEPEECTTTAKLGKSLADAYRIASGKPDLEYFKSLLQQFQEETVALEAAQRQREAEAAEKAEAKAKRDAEKKARKSKGGDDDIEMADGDAPKATKKRKKEADSDADGAKSKKTPKITKLNAPKTPNGDSTKKAAPKKKVAAPKGDDSAEQAPMTESERLAHREKSVLYLRHKLQKAFLSREVAPKEDEMPEMDGYFVQLEKLEDLEPELIRKTKIHKVLKGIVKLDTIPLEEKFTFKKRSQDMLETWNRRMGVESDAAPKSAVSVDKAAPTTNGDANDTKEGASNVDADAATAEKQADEIDTKIEQAESNTEAANAPKEDTKAEPTAEQATESKDVVAENAGEGAAAPDDKPKDADGDVKMDDGAAGNAKHD